MRKDIIIRFWTLFFILLIFVFLIIPYLNYSTTQNNFGDRIIEYNFAFNFSNKSFGQFLLNIFSIFEIKYIFYVCLLLIFNFQKFKTKLKISLLIIFIFIFLGTLTIGILQVLFSSYALNTILMIIFSVIIFILVCLYALIKTTIV